MIPEKLREALIDQINHEYFSSYLYLAMSADFSSKNLDGFASWMRIQAQEEAIHAMKIFDFLIERGEKIVLKAIEKPQETWETPLAAIEAALNHEKFITAKINDLVDLAIDTKDHSSFSFLQWFVDEQVEEEATADAILQKIKMIKDSSGALFYINKELGGRPAKIKIVNQD